MLIGLGESDPLPHCGLNRLHRVETRKTIAAGVDVCRRKCRVYTFLMFQVVFKWNEQHESAGYLLSPWLLGHKVAEICQYVLKKTQMNKLPVLK